MRERAWLVALAQASCLWASVPSSAAAAGLTLGDDFRSGVNLALDVRDAPNGAACLSLMRDGKDLELRPEPCGVSDASQVWYYFNEGLFQVGSVFLDATSDNSGAVQVHARSDTAASTGSAFAFSFVDGGKIRNEQLQRCLAPGFLAHAGPEPTQFLSYVDCGAAPVWHLRQASLPMRLAGVPSGGGGGVPVVEHVPTTPVVHHAQVPEPEPVPVPVPQTQPQAQAQTQPHVEVAAHPGGFAGGAGSAKDVATWKAGQPVLSEKDSFLCICVTNDSDDLCTEAVKAGCVVGIIPSEHCRASFEEGDHDSISKSIVALIDNGAKCSQHQAGEAGFSEGQLPTNAFHGQEFVTAEDHYLCVCLANGGDVDTLDKHCEDAVRVACTVGHIPEADCFASFDEQNHATIVERIMKLIDSGAHCNKELKLHPFSKDASRDPHAPSYKDAHLCTCLEDRHSDLCEDAVEAACRLGHIPAADCEVAQKAGFHHSVTRHILHLVDHGAECGLAGHMTFTNRGCHCKQRWSASASGSAEAGRVLEFPDNCGDPGDERGFDWCETFPDEGCVGVGDSLSWDRCDHPRQPRYHLGQFASTAIGKVHPVDAYLCPCVDLGSSDELCLAASKAACQVGHLPAEACAQSFDSGEHADIADSILEAVANGARCNSASVAAVAHASQVPFTDIANGCGRGDYADDGSCRCHRGFAGVRCDHCAAGMVGYPECAPKVDCSPACFYGSCDFSRGACDCPKSRRGARCEECAAGYGGKACSPSGLFGAGPLGTLLAVGICVGLVYSCCCTPTGARMLAAATKAGAARAGVGVPRGTYARLSSSDGGDGDGDGERGADLDTNLDLDHGRDLDLESLDKDMDIDIERPAPERAPAADQPARPQLAHTGLAI